MYLPLLYRFVFRLITPFLLVRLWLRGKKNPAYRQHISQRLGYAPKLSGCLWLHAVSLGESIAATPLIKALLARYPDLPLLITNTTPTGRAHITKIFGDSVIQAYLPYDTPGSIKRFITRTQPRIAIIMETELWPTLLSTLKQHSIPSIIANARLSERSRDRYQRLGNWMASTLQNITRILPQSPLDAEHFLSIGAHADSTPVTGNIKYDATLAPGAEAKAQEWRSHWGDRFTWIVASTHPGEDEKVLDAHEAILKQHPNALMLIAPRHPERFDAVADLIEQRGHRFCRRSKHQWPSEDQSVFLLDSLGELTTWYGCADAAFVAGSFATIGGHNLIEPALHRRPVISGPNLNNFVAMSELMKERDALRVVQDPKELAETILNYQQHPEQAKKDGEAAYAVTQEHQGACDRIMAHIVELLGN